MMTRGRGSFHSSFTTSHATLITSIFHFLVRFPKLFLRGIPKLRSRMKRLPARHRKMPVDKDDQCPDFHALAKVSPLPEADWNSVPPSSAKHNFPNVVGGVGGVGGTGIIAGTVVGGGASAMGVGVLGAGSSEGGPREVRESVTEGIGLTPTPTEGIGLTPTLVDRRDRTHSSVTEGIGPTRVPHLSPALSPTVITL